MKKFICNTLFIVIIFFLASCSPKTEYINAIPHDASLVVSIDMDKIVQKSGLNEENGKILIDKISNALKSGLGAKSYKAIENILKEPSKSGISFNDKIYIFTCSSSNLFGILAKLDDDDDFESLIDALNEEGLSSEVRDGDKCQWAKIGNIFCGFNNGTLMLLSNGSNDTSGMKETLMTYMRQDKGKSFASTEYFNKLSESKVEMAMVLNFSLLPSDLASQLKIGMSADLKLDDLKYLLNIDFNNGNISCRIESLISEKSIIHTLDKVDNSTMKVTNDLLEYYPASAVIWCGASIKGEKLYDILSKNPAIEHLLNDPMIPIDINDIFSAIDGDVALSFATPSLDEMLLYAKVNTDDFMSEFDELMPLIRMTGGQMTLKKTGKATYEFAMMGEKLWFGVRNNLLYITNSADLASKACEKYSVSLLNTKASLNIAESRFVTFINAQQIVAQMDMMSDYTLKMMKPILNYCDYATINVPNWRNGKIEIVMKDKNQNALQLLVKELQKI